MAPYTSTYASPQQMYAPVYAEATTPYASAEMYAPQYAYPEYTTVYQQQEQSTGGWSDVAMLAVAGAAVGAAVGTFVQKRTTAARASTPEMKAALLYSTTTGNTETAAGYIADATGLEAVDIGDQSGTYDPGVW